MTVMGQMPEDFLGVDAAGVVLRVGSGATRFKAGDRVAMCQFGAHRTVHRSKADFCELIPDGLTFEQAASIPCIHGTAWYGLIRLARIQKGQSILIHAAAGGVGQVAIQIALYHGLEVYATVGSEVKRALLRDTYGIPDDHIFSSRNMSFVAGIKRMTGGRGVDVILNSLAGEALRQSWYCLAPFGTFVEIGLKDILGNTRLDMRPFVRDATFSFFNLHNIQRERPKLMADIIGGAFDFYRRGITTTVSPLTTYPISEVENAFRLMQTGNHIGKIVFTFGENDAVPILRSSVAATVKLDLRPEASYVLVGGLGGLGRSLATMLADNGARNLCFLSRSGGAASDSAQSLIHDLKKRGVQVRSFACDVSDVSALRAALEQCSAELGPVRGVIQCAMALRDTLFANMSHDQWLESTRPKIQGTQNLDAALPDVDFFVALSSFAGTFGNRGQSNYAAGCAYQDALAIRRRREGKPATSLDVGLMRDIGVLAEKGTTDGLKDWEEPYGIRAGELLDLVKLAAAGLMPAQVLTGLATGGSAVVASIPQPYYLADSKFAIMAETDLRKATSSTNGSGAAGSGNNTDSVQELLARSKDIREATEHVAAALVGRVAKMLQTTNDEISVDRALHSYGVDSLVAIEMVNWALKELKARITVFDLMAAVPITATAAKIAAASSIVPKEVLS
jgi:NADPH:quinone reductase-like Zn-dependent oxidoreductase/NADP-dependent 3-hydroxy acid dehydrogenase YdfG/aryl carrier-like protein